jgi:hypothetical protein
MSEDAPVNTGTGEWPSPDSAYFAVGEDADQVAPLAVIRSSETAVSGGWKGPGQMSWLQLICPMVGVIPAPHDAWRKSDIPMVATGYQCCGSRDVRG